MLGTLLLATLAAGPSPLAGCRAQSWAGAGWEYRCASRLTARVVDTDNPWQVSGAVLSGPTAPPVTEARSLAGRWVDVQRWRGGGVTSSRAVVQRDEGGRVLLCWAVGDGKACDPVLEVLAGRPWRAGPVEDALAVADPPLLLRGQPVVVPPLCEASVIPEGGEVRCGTGMTVWAEESEAAAQGRVGAMRRMIASITGAEPPAPEVRPCRLAGVRTTCSLWLMKTADGQVLGATAHVPAGGRALSGACVAYGALELATPPCPLLFALE